MAKVMFTELVGFFVVAKCCAQIPEDAIQTGRTQYQLLLDRASLPQYGDCWKRAIHDVHEGCSSLSEHSQSEIALRLSACFLEMSGHEPHRCDADVKPNVRRICVGEMNDRAFHVYTEFYTHTQNICWFLKGQVWQETIAEKTYEVGRQLEESAKSQQELLRVQKESLKLQERLMEHGKDLEKVVETIVRTVAFIQHSVIGIQNWLISEMSWFETILFYAISLFFVLMFTSLRSTNSCRLPLLVVLFGGLFSERFMCSLFVLWRGKDDVNDSHLFFIKFIWYFRYGLVAFCAAIVIFAICSFKDYERINNKLLGEIYEQNVILFKKVMNESNSKQLQVLQESENGLIKHVQNVRKRNADSPEVHCVKKYNLRSRQATPV